MTEWKVTWDYVSSRIRRRKIISAHDQATDLKRCLTTFHLTFMGLGNTVGVGIYVLVGMAAKLYAGPGVLLSFVLAGVLTMMNAVSFAEFGARIPKTGAFYTYAYESSCELLAFLIGWLNLMGLVSCNAITLRALSGYVDSIFNNYIQTSITDYLGKVTLGPPFSEDLDFMAFIFQLLVIIIISVGVNISAMINSLLAGVSVLVLIFISVMGFIYGDFSNITNYKHDGFLPFGIQGVLAGSAACFYAYTGFDVICMSAEECKTPSKSVPRAIFYQLVIVTLLYVGSSLGLLLLIPWYKIDETSPLPSAFAYHGLTWAKILVGIGPALGIGNLSILGMYSLSRHVYCMSSDGLFFKIFLSISPRTQVPVPATLLFGIIVAVASLLLEISNLVNFNVISMFFGFIMCNMILILSRKIDPCGVETPGEEEEDDDACAKEEHSVLERLELRTVHQQLCMMASFVGLNNLLYLVVIASFGLCLQLTLGINDVINGNLLAFISLGLLLGLIIFLSLLISMETGPATHEGFSMPYVPFFPVFVIVVNIALLIVAVDVAAIVGYAVLISLGFVFYFAIILFGNGETNHKQGEDEISLMEMRGDHYSDEDEVWSIEDR